MQTYIYCDNAATTKTRSEVVEAMLPVFTEAYGNASSLHRQGRKAKALLDNARKQVAGLLNCLPSEVYFTSGGTESNNIALRGTAAYATQSGLGKNHIISCVTEHSAVQQPLKKLEAEGWEVTWLKVDREGFIDMEDLKSSLKPSTILVSIMHANNEIGTIQDIKKIGNLCRERGVLFHTDAVQSAGKVPIDVLADQVDLLSISGHKIYGPKGVGILYVRKGVSLCPIIWGGTQEHGYKPGTENLPGIVGIGKAIELRKAEQEAEALRLKKMARELYLRLEKIPGVSLNGPRDWERRVPGNVNISLDDIDGDTSVLHLDLKGICVSSGSACAEGSIEPSRVVSALYAQPSPLAFNSIRFSLGLHNHEDEVPAIAEALDSVVQKLRAKSLKAA